MTAKPKQILVATTNPGKVRELRAMLSEDVQWLGLTDFADVQEVEEDGHTFAENARKKALGYAKATGLWTIADDSGLVVDALDGAPGVKSARFSGDIPGRAERKAVDERNCARVLELLGGVPAEKRTARFVCCLCLAGPEGVLAEATGMLEGLITAEPAGQNGFGYDPIFFVPQANKTVAQLTSEQKNAISHRGNAIRELKPLLVRLAAEQ